ncbi:MAG: hypothetical protein FWC89_13400 [Defluviitaleaceae bacterium]|nr:hypothetical protein [Defluviitaleaceae bacterium]
MKEYKEYMDSIKLEADVQERLSQQATYERIEAKRGRTILPLLGVAAVMALIFLGIRTGPTLFRQWYYENDATSGNSTDNPNEAESLDEVALENMYELTFAQVRVNTGGRFFRTHDDYSIWLGGRNVMPVPGMTTLRHGTALYDPTGELIRFSASETEQRRNHRLRPAFEFEYNGFVTSYTPSIFEIDSITFEYVMPQTPFEIAMYDFRRSQEFQAFRRDAMILAMTPAEITQAIEELNAIPIVRASDGVTRTWNQGEMLLFSQVNTALEFTMWTGERTWFDMAFYNVERGEQPAHSYVQGVAVTAWTYNFWGELYQLGADFMFEGNTYAIRTMDTREFLEEGKQRLTESVNRTISNGGLDFNVVAPQLDFTGFRNDRLSFEMAQNDVQFGAFVPSPATIPERFSQMVASPVDIQYEFNPTRNMSIPTPVFVISRNINTRENMLELLWHDWPNTLTWSIFEPSEEELQWIYTPNEPESIHQWVSRFAYQRTIGQAATAFSAMAFSEPFLLVLAEDVTLDLINNKTNIFGHGTNGEIESAYTTSINILHNDTAIRIRSTGSSPEEIFTMLQSIGIG